MRASPHRSQWIFSKGIEKIFLDNSKGILQIFPIWQLAQILNLLIQHQ